MVENASKDGVTAEQKEIVGKLKELLETHSVDKKMLEGLKELKITAKDSVHPNTICRFDWTCWPI